MDTTMLNEETAKLHVIRYFQEQLGLSLEHIECETPFRIRLGRQEHSIPPIQGRLDVLIRRQGRNLCVIEMKAEDKELTDDDRRQATSYARLLDPWAPLALVTNGIESRLYDVLTGNPLNRKPLSIDSLYEITPPGDFLRRKEEALLFFLGLSPNNLQAFCSDQVKSQLRRIKGSATDRNRKYLPELFVPRAGVRETVRSFLEAPQPLLVLSGDAGIGKTCELCALAEYLLAENIPVLFYFGSTLVPEALLRTIAEDFAWTFSAQDTQRDLVHELSVMLGERNLLIIIDALDEWNYAGRMQDLLSMSGRLIGKHVKLLASCKTLAWREFAERRGVPTGIDDCLFGGAPHRLLPMSAAEQMTAIEKYRAFYGVHGAFESQALRAAQESPFILRVLFEVASKRGEDDLMFSSLQFFRDYYDQTLNRLDDLHRDAGARLLKATAGLLFEKDRDEVPVDELFQIADLKTVTTLVSELVQCQILERTGDPNDSSVRFYFSLLRDYLIAFLEYRWPERSDAELRAILEDSSYSGVRTEALAFFYRYCEASKQQILAGDLRATAQAYLQFYDQLLREHFPSLRHQFPPYTMEAIGFVGELIVSQRTLGFYGFRELPAGDEEVKLIPLPRSERSNLLSLYGVLHEQGVGRFERANMRELVLEYEIGRRLRGLVDEGLLDESCSPLLAAEVVACAVSRNRHVFSDGRASSSAGPLFPLEVAKVRRWWEYELLHTYFLDQCFTRRLRELGEGKQGVSSDDLRAEDYAWIRDSVERNLGEADEVVRSWVRPERRNLLSRIDRQLTRAFATLDAAGIQVIEEHPFPLLANPQATMWSVYPASYRADLCRYVEELLALAYPLAKRLIEHNFPSFLREFPCIKDGPFLGVVEMQFESRVSPFGTLYICEPDEAGGEAKFVARSHEQIETRIERNPEFRFEVRCDGVWRRRIDRDLIGQRHLGLRSLLHPSHDYLGFGGHFSGPGEVQPVIRAVVYDWIRQELAHAYRVFSLRYEIDPGESRWSLFSHARN